jgi:hypothetical protein
MQPQVPQAQLEHRSYQSGLQELYEVNNQQLHLVAHSI